MFLTQDKCNVIENPAPYWKAKILPPIEIFAYGVSANAFSDYCQMLQMQARECMIQFTRAISTDCFDDTYLCSPTPADIKSIIAISLKNQA